MGHTQYICYKSKITYFHSKALSKGTFRHLFEGGWCDSIHRVGILQDSHGAQLRVITFELEGFWWKGFYTRNELLHLWHKSSWSIAGNFSFTHLFQLFQFLLKHDQMVHHFAKTMSVLDDTALNSAEFGRSGSYRLMFSFTLGFSLQIWSLQSWQR